MLKPTDSYRHFKPEDRMTISSLMQQNFTQRDIAKLLGCSSSSVSRELGRNAQGKTYDSKSAQRACQHRRIASRPRRKLHTESIFVWRCTHPDALTLVSRANRPFARKYLSQGNCAERVTRDHIQMHLCPIRRRTAQRFDCLPAPGE